MHIRPGPSAVRLSVPFETLAREHPFYFFSMFYSLERPRKFTVFKSCVGLRESFLPHRDRFIFWITTEVEKFLVNHAHFHWKASCSVPKFGVNSFCSFH